MGRTLPGISWASRLRPAFAVPSVELRSHPRVGALPVGPRWTRRWINGPVWPVACACVPAVAAASKTGRSAAGGPRPVFWMWRLAAAVARAARGAPAMLGLWPTGPGVRLPGCAWRLLSWLSRPAAPRTSRALLVLRHPRAFLSQLRQGARAAQFACFLCGDRFDPAADHWACLTCDLQYCWGCGLGALASRGPLVCHLWVALGTQVSWVRGVCRAYHAARQFRLTDRGGWSPAPLPHGRLARE